MGGERERPRECGGLSVALGAGRGMFLPERGGFRRSLLSGLRGGNMSVVEANAAPWATAGITGVRVAAIPEGADHILTADAVRFVARLHRAFNSRRLELLRARGERRRAIDSGEMPDFLAHTRGVGESEWRVGPIPQDLLDRRVEITGPVDRKMIINALNSGARVFMADFEDSHSPTWAGTIEGQMNLYDAVRGTISYESPEGKHYSVAPGAATLMVRPRGWHLVEKHMQVDGRPVSAALFDFGLCFFHNALELCRRGSGPYFYLPKMESHLEARLWNDVFIAAQ